MKSMKKLIPALAMLLVSLIVMSSASFAWFSMNKTVTATGLEIKAKSNATFLLIGEEALSTSDAIQAQTGDDLINEALTVVNAAMYPSKPYFSDANDAFATNVTTATAITTKTTAGTVGNWYTANSTDSTVWGGSGKVTQDAVLTDTNFADHVIKRSVNLTLADGSTKANNLTVTPNITMKDTYAKTSDIALNGSKTYYTESAGIYTAVDSPDVSAIGTYYEKANDISAVKVLVVTDNDKVVVLSSADNGTAKNLYGSNNIDITSTEVHHVDIYVYYDGTETAVYTNNAVNLSGATVDLQFDVEVNE